MPDSHRGEFETIVQGQEFTPDELGETLSAE
jgi:hypothetical protein